jgi:thiol-disulfide isomerase/thioredoxin
MARSSRDVLQSFVFMTLICAGFVFSLSNALAEQATAPLNPPQAKPISKDAVTGNFGEAFDPSLNAEGAAALMPESGADADRGADEDDHWAGDGHDHGSELTGSLVRVKRVAELNDQVVPGINTTPGNLKALLSPGTIVHFWASWCGPCEEEFPQLERFYRTHISEELKAKGVRLITISNDLAAAPAARFIEKHGTTFPVYLDSEQTTNLAMVGQRALPSTVMIDADGRFHRLALGKLDWDFPRLPDILAATAARKPGAGNGANDQ